MAYDAFDQSLQAEQLFDPVAWWGRVDGSRTALIEASTGRAHSYAALNADAELWAARLRALGVGHGSRVAVFAQNRAEFIALLFACVRVGALLVPLNWRLSAAELSRVLVDAEPSIMFGEDRYHPTACEAMLMAGLAVAPRWIDLDHGIDSVPEDRGIEQRVDARSTNDAVLLLYTSGSTGTPKGVVISHRQLLANAIATTTAWGIGPDDVGPAVTPFFHTGGWNVFTTPMLFRGATVVLIDGFDADSFLDTLERFGLTVTFGVPTQLAMLRASPKWGMPLPKLRWFISGGAPCPQRIKDDVRAAGYRFREGYGLTECGPNCFATNDETALNRVGTVGWPITFLQMRLRGDDGVLVADDQIGELELRGPQLFAGYFRAPEKTAEVMTPDGWMRTGDLASRAPDGVFTIRGRRKEMFISGGENVFPGEVEAALLDCTGVTEVAVIGVPDARWGEVGCAIVVRLATTLDAPSLIAQARTRLAGYKVPKQVHFVDALPRLGSGKIDRRALVELIAQSISTTESVH